MIIKQNRSMPCRSRAAELVSILPRLYLFVEMAQAICVQVGMASPIIYFSEAEGGAASAVARHSQECKGSTE